MQSSTLMLEVAGSSEMVTCIYKPVWHHMVLDCICAA